MGVRLMKRRSLWLVAGGLLLSLALMGLGRTRAEDPILATMYGSGVHAYFSSQWSQAHDLFTSAIEGGTRDPRPYYFRALTFIKSGRPELADADFAEGAKREAEDISGFFNVSRALERV